MENISGLVKLEEEVARLRQFPPDLDAQFLLLSRMQTISAEALGNIQGNNASN